MKFMKKCNIMLLASFCMLASSPIHTYANQQVPHVGDGSEQKDATASIQKDFVFAQGMTTPTKTFEFEIQSMTPNAPKATLSNVTFSDADSKKLVDGVYKISKTSEIRFSDLKEAGEFVYIVKEVAKDETAGNGQVIFSTKEYKLRVYVANKEQALGEFYVETITAQELTPQGEGDKVANITFENVYTKNASLQIQKQTSGTFADKKKPFTFHITLTPPNTHKDLQKTNATVNGTPVEISFNQPYTFTLAHNQALVFDQLPVGTTYVVEEQGATDGYTPSITVLENGMNKTSESNKKVLESQGIVTNQTLVGEQENKVVFTNTYKDIPITGIISNNLSFIVMVGIGATSLVVLALAKGKKKQS